jgi:VanZ family protein
VKRDHTPSLSSQLEHVAAYFGTAAVLALGYPGRRPLLAIAVLLTGYAGLLEACQLWVPGRMARAIDSVAGSIGAWTGVFLAQLVRVALSSSARPGET